MTVFMGQMGGIILFKILETIGGRTLTMTKFRLGNLLKVMG
jgi:hypothetical protein